MVRTRFAPSPTGFLHIGSARTALYCWLYAKRFAGIYILRIEDTDLERSTPESVQTIMDGLTWLGLHEDEGPYFQTKRFDRYKEVITQMLTEGKAYRCYCSRERLEEMRNQQMANKQKPRYDGHCRNGNHSSLNDSFVVRFKNPQTGTVNFVDLVRGPLEFANTELDDLIIARSDGSPTYNFTVVIDDIDMKISHVIRGDDHINNAPRQINIFTALDAPIPHYAHIPMILGSDGKKLSKRQGAVSVMEFRDDGFLPKALINYLVRLGWSHGDQEIFSEAELIEYFDFDKVSRSPAAFNTEKLLWLNQHYLKTLPAEEISSELAWHMNKLGIDTSKGPKLTDIISAQAERTKTLKEMAEKSRFFYETIIPDEQFLHSINSDVLTALKEFKIGLEKLSDWTKEGIHDALVKTSEKFDIKLGKLAQPLRLILTGTSVTPPLDLTVSLLGKPTALARLENALSSLEK